MKRKKNQKQEENQNQNENQNQMNNMFNIQFPREEDIINLNVKLNNLLYLAELVDIYMEYAPEFYRPLTKKILNDLPKIVELDEDSLEINIDLLNSPIPYTPDKMNCNPLTFNELRRLLDEIIAYASVLPSDDVFARLAEIDVTQYYDDMHKPNNTYFIIKSDDLVVIKIDPIDFLDSAEILDKIQAQQLELSQAQSQNRRPKLVLSQKWLFEILIPRFPELLTCHPKSPVKIDVSKTESFDALENPLTPYEINRIIDMILKVSGVLPEDLASFH
jgi:hypothetical protein